MSTTQTPTIMQHNRNWVGIPMHTQNGQAALTTAGLNWTVENHKLDEFIEFEGRKNAERHQVALRSDGAIMGVNGKRHTIIQNQALAELGDAIIKMNGSFHYVAGGSTLTGETCFLVLQSDELITFDRDGTDRGFNSIMLVNDFNGNVPLSAIGWQGRFACTNIIRGLLRNRKARLVTVHHTSGSTWQLEVAKQTLIEYVHQVDEVELELRRLIEIELQPAEARTMLTTLAGQEPEQDGRARTMWENRRHEIRAEYNAPWNTGLQGTALGVVMAAQGYDEHRTKCGKGKRDAARTRRLISGDYPTMDRALALVS